MIKVEKRHTFTGHSAAVYALEQSAELHLFYSGSGDKFIAQWNLETMQAEKFAAQLPSIIYTICFVREKNILLIGTAAGSIHVIDLTKKEELKILQHHTDAVYNIQYHFESGLFYSVGGDGNFAVCSLETLSLLKIRKIASAKVRAIDFNLLDNSIAIASSDGFIRIYDLWSSEQKIEFEAHKMAANCVRFSPDGRFLLSGGRDAHLNIWDVKDGYNIMKSIPAHNFAIYDIVFSPDGKLFATASRDKTLKIWDSQSFELLMRVNKEKQDGHVNSVNKLLWTKEPQFLISAGDDRSIMVWEVLTGQS